MSLTGPQLGCVLLLAGAGALVLTLWMRSQLPGWVLLPLALAAAFLPPLLSKDLRYVDVHGFLHASYVYALMNRGLPPEDVLMAGEPLRYPWAQHYLTALVCRAAAVSPADVFLATNAAALLGTLGFVAGTSRLIDKDRRTTVCAVLLALVGTSVFHAGPLQGWINHLPKVRLDERVVPLHKYTLANGNPLGFLGFSAFLYLAVKVFSTGRITAREWVGLALAVAFLGYFYPIAWMALLAAASAICVAHGIRTRAPRLSAAVGAAVIAGSACAAPYVAAIGSGKSATAAVTLHLTPGYAITNLFSALCAVALPAAVIWLRRRSLGVLWSARPAEITTLGAAAAALGGLYCVLYIPTESQYKILALACLTIAIGIAPLVREVWVKSAPIATLGAFLLLLPAATFIVHLSQTWEAIEPAHAQGSALVADAPGEAALYAWLRSHTAPDAVVADTYLSVPALGQRSLYLGTDLLPKRPEQRDGWGMHSANVLAEINGQDPERIARRREQVEAVFGFDPHGDVDTALTDMARECAPRELLAIARTPEQARRLDGARPLERCFTSGAAAVYRFRSAPRRDAREW